jgi:hypothetical protein
MTREMLALQPIESTRGSGEAAVQEGIAVPNADDVIAQENEAAALPQRTTSSSPADIIYPSSSSGDIDLEKQRTNSEDIIHDHVDVQYAERQFADLKRRYSNLSRVASGASQRSRRPRPSTAESEKGRRLGGRWTEDVEESDDEFDLEDMLRDRHRKEVEHDIKPKHLGLCPWGIGLIGRCCV